MEYLFPFGQKLKRLVQQDRTPKEIFVLGVYASAVHAKWICGKEVICQALAIASEPYIFWNGDVKEAQAIIDTIHIPQEVGKLFPANKNLNGPSAKVLEENIFKPLGVNRKQAWLCDLLPESRINPNQAKVIEQKYNPLIDQYGLNRATIPLEHGDFCDEQRRIEIVNEILESKAKKLVLLGDIPIKQFLKYIADIDFNSLREYTEKYGYGNPYYIRIHGVDLEVIPLAHPRQIGGLGRSNVCWLEEHKRWEEKINICLNDLG